MKQISDARTFSLMGDMPSLGKRLGGGVGQRWITEQNQIKCETKEKLYLATRTTKPLDINDRN